MTFRVFFLLCLFPLSALADRIEQQAQTSVRAANSLLLDIVQAESRLIAVGEQGTVIYSDDSGQQWQQADVESSVLLTAITIADQHNYWAVGHDGVLLHSGDQGASWQLKMSGEQINQQRLETLQMLEQREQARSEPDEDALENISYALEEAEYSLEDGASVPLLDIEFIDQNTGFILGGYGTLLRTADGGQSWSNIEFNSDNIDRFHLNALMKQANGTLWILGEAGLLLRSDDIGLSWQAEYSPYEGSWFAGAELDGLYLLGLRGNLYHSATGDDWQPLDLNSEATINGAVAGQQSLWLVGQGGLLAHLENGHFQLKKAPVRRSFSAGVNLGDHLILVGEGGVSRFDVAQLNSGGDK